MHPLTDISVHISVDISFDISTETPPMYRLTYWPSVSWYVSRHMTDIEETAFSMSKIHFNANHEGTILQSNRNARMTIQYKWTQLVKRGHLQELRKMRDNKQVLKIIRSVRNTKHGRLVWPSTWVPGQRVYLGKVLVPGWRAQNSASPLVRKAIG